MKKFYLADIFDIIFTGFVTFIIIYVILNYFIERPYSIILSALAAVLAIIPIYKIIIKKSAGRRLKKTEKIHMNETLTHLSVCPKKDVTEIFEKALNNLSLSFEKKRGYISVPDKNIDAFIFTDVDGLKKSDVVKVFNTVKSGDTAVIFSCYMADGVKEFCERFDGKIRIISDKSLYLFLKNSDALPEERVELKKEKPASGFLERILSGKKAVKYFLFGLSFFGLSFLVRYKFYYLTMGSLFILLALVSVLFKRRKESETEIPFF